MPARRAVSSELKRADLICTCTTNNEPVFELKDIRPGVHITAMGAYRPAEGDQQPPSYPRHRGALRPRDR